MWIVAGLLACSGDAGEWQVLDGLDGGVMLSAADVGDEVLIVGGHYGQSGSLWRYGTGQLCVEQDVAPGALWWIHGRSASDWYAVGDRGLVVHEIDGQRVREDVPTDMTLFGVYDDGQDVWVVGGDVAETQTGAVWRKAEGGDWELVDTTPGLAFKVHEGWVVGEGFAWRWQGDGFVDATPPDAPRLLTVRVRSPQDVWAVGRSPAPVVVHWDGTAWSSPPIDRACLRDELNGVFTTPDQVWVAGAYGTLASWDGTTWTCSDEALTAEHFHAVWQPAHAPTEILALGGNLFGTTDLYATFARQGGSAQVSIGACP